MSNINYIPPAPISRLIQMLAMGTALSTFEPNERVKTMVGIFSVNLGSPIKVPRPLSQDRDITAVDIRNVRSSLSFNYNAFKTGGERTQKEILQAIRADYPDADSAVQTMTTIHKPPKNIDIASDDIFVPYVKHGHYTNLLWSLGFYHIRNPYDMIKNQLKPQGLWDDSWRNRLRGVCAGGIPYKVETVNEKLHQIPVFLQNQTADIEQLNVKLLGKAYTKDVAIPTMQTISYVGGSLPVSTYNLRVRKKQIAIGWEEF